MLNIIIAAIKNKHKLAFTYSGIHRIVEPHAVGSSRAGKDVLRCFQTHGGHITPGHEWDLCELSKISKLTDTGESFANARPDYKKGDKGMSRIYAEL
jgi:hypothetical protein